ncbi:hypothetical protein C8R47DRAFT_1193439, partial [Mycena vitilis]
MDVDSDADESPGYFNVLTPEDEEPLELDGWAGFDEVLDADKPILRDDMIAKADEMIGPEGELWAMRNETLTEQDRDTIRAFWLIMKSNMSREIFKHMRYAFSKSCRGQVAVDDHPPRRNPVLRRACLVSLLC